MRSYLNIFLTLVMPVGILFTAVATIYFATSFDFSKALRLGIVAGALTGIGFSLFASLILGTIKVIRRYRLRKKITKTTPTYTVNNDPIVIDPTIYEKKSQTVQSYQTVKNIEKFSMADAIEEKFMLLMDKELAYEVSLSTINQGKIGVIIHQNKEEGAILLRSADEEIKIVISSLTKHTSEVHITSTIDNNNIKNIISVLKEKEHSFIQY